MRINTNTKKYFYWLISFISIFVILLTVYYYLGGFVDIQTAVVKNSNYSIAGREINGELTSKQEHFLFEEMKGFIADSVLNGTLCVVNYDDDTLKSYETHRFIGVLLTDEISMIPGGLEVLELKSVTSIQAALIMHPLVMPNTQKVEKKLVDKADSLGLVLRNITLEKLYQDNSVIVEMFAE